MCQAASQAADWTVKRRHGRNYPLTALGPITPTQHLHNTTHDVGEAPGRHYCPRIIDLVQEEEAAANEKDGKKACIHLT